MAIESIQLITFGSMEKDLLLHVQSAVNHEFDLPVKLREGHLDMSEFLDPARGQYDANKLIKALDHLYVAAGMKTLGIFNTDLFIPILTYIFGQAFLNGSSGIVSIHRLRNERYGLKADDQVLTDRLIKEVIHELGHTFGLIHCHNPVCVMHSSTYVEDIDQKSRHICLMCRSQLSS